MAEISRQTILVVEDSPDDVFILERVLQRAQITNPLQIARDGQEAVDYLSGANHFADRERFPLPHLVLLDLKLPFLNGFEVLEWLRADGQLRNLNVAILTSSAEDRDVTRAAQLGVTSYLIKPPTISVMQELMAKFDGVNRPAGTGA